MDFSRYENKMPYPDRPRKPRALPLRHTVADLEEYSEQFMKYVAERDKYDAHMKRYKEEKRRLFDLFKIDALMELGIEAHPKGYKAFDMAWEEGHSFGYHEVFTILSELAELMT